MSSHYTDQLDAATRLIRDATRPISFGFICAELNCPIFKTLRDDLTLRHRHWTYRGKTYFGPTIPSWKK